MNYRLVLKTYTALRQMSPDDLALLDTLRGLSDTEREMMMDALSPQKPAAKKSTKKRGKSQRASGMAAALSRNLMQERQINEGACAHMLECGLPCNTGDNNPIHDKSFGYGDYHEFVPASTEQSAAVSGS